MNRLFPANWLRPAPVSSELDRFLHDFWNQVPLQQGRSASAEGGPALNVYESGDAYEVELELPGLALEDVEVVLEGRDLTVRGERKSALPEDATWQRRERAHGSFARTLRLPLDIDAGRVQARLDQGVLTIALPKAESVKARRIQIESKPHQQPLS